MTDKAAKVKANITPIDTALVPAAAAFLHDHMNSRFSNDVWAKCLQNDWTGEAPNYGFVLQHEDKVVGVICALYSEQCIDGETYKLCNPHSWSVLPEFRSQSVALVLSTIKQKGYHFTMFTPNQEGLEIFTYLRFKPLEKSTVRTINWPTKPFSGAIKFETERSKMLALLEGTEKQKLADHLAFDWIFPVVYQTESGSGFMMFKPDRFKRMKAAQLLYHSDSDTVLKHWSAVRSMLLLKFGVVTTKLETRLFDQALPFGHWSEDDHQRFFLSSSLQPEQVQYLYSEMFALDL